jgi:thiol-disulfide isomerase/thioredoxin
MQLAIKWLPFWLFCWSVVAAAGDGSGGDDGTSVAPAMQLKNLKGEQRTLADFRGKVVLVNFWASWCPPCISEMPALKRLSQSMADRSFALLAVNVAEGRGIVQRFASLEESGIELLRDVDGKVAKDWGVEVYPTSVIVDGLGRRQATIVGETDWDAQALYDRLEELVRTTTPTRGN